MKPFSICALLLCGAAVAGCYRTVDLASPEPAPETRVVAEVSPVAAEAISPLIGPDALRVEGRVVRWGPADAELALFRVDHRGSSSVLWNHERVRFPVDALRNVRERRLDTTRTALLIGGVAGGATVLAITFLRFVGVFDEGPGGGTDPTQ